jgi:hypothetical protein
MMVNDEYRPAHGTLTLTLEGPSGQTLARSKRQFDLPALGDGSYELALTVPEAAGKCILKATAKPDAPQDATPTVSRRWVTVEKSSEAISPRPR